MTVKQFENYVEILKNNSDFMSCVKLVTPYIRLSQLFPFYNFRENVEDDYWKLYSPNSIANEAYYSHIKALKSLGFNLSFRPNCNFSKEQSEAITSIFWSCLNNTNLSYNDYLDNIVIYFCVLYILEFLGSVIKIGNDNCYFNDLELSIGNELSLPYTSQGNLNRLNCFKSGKKDWSRFLFVTFTCLSHDRFDCFDFDDITNFIINDCRNLVSTETLLRNTLLRFVKKHYYEDFLYAIGTINISIVEITDYKDFKVTDDEMKTYRGSLLNDECLVNELDYKYLFSYPKELQKAVYNDSFNLDILRRSGDYDCNYRVLAKNDKHNYSRRNTRFDDDLIKVINNSSSDNEFYRDFIQTFGVAVIGDILSEVIDRSYCLFDNTFYCIRHAERSIYNHSWIKYDDILRIIEYKVTKFLEFTNIKYHKQLRYYTCFDIDITDEEFITLLNLILNAKSSIDILHSDILHKVVVRILIDLESPYKLEPWHNAEYDFETGCLIKIQ